MREHSLKSSHLKSEQVWITAWDLPSTQGISQCLSSAGWRHPASQSSPVLHRLWLSPSPCTEYSPDLKPLFLLSPKAPSVSTSIALVSQEDT